MKRPVGVIPPHVYGINDVVADPVALYKYARSGFDRAVIQKEIDKNWAENTARQEKAAERSSTLMSDREFAAVKDKALKVIASPPTIFQAAGLDIPVPVVPSLSELVPGNAPVTFGVPQLADQLRADLAAALAGTAAEKAGGSGGIVPAESQSGTGPLGSAFLFADQFFAANPPDP